MSENRKLQTNAPTPVIAPRKVYVIGHKNPDTDSICSAIAYADIKRRTEDGIFEAKRAGQISQETQYVLDRFQVDPPGYVPNVAPRVKDMEIRRIPGVSDHISLKKAWNLMRTQNVNTLPIVQEGNMLEGLITISDIAKSYMDVYDNAILSTARTQYKNILETLDGTMVVGNEHAYFVKGKVVIAAANPDLMENYIEEDDLVILGNRYESQLCAIEMKAGCIIVCEGAPVSKTIQRLAAERVCAVISTPHDTYTVARLINQSMPVKFFMKSSNLITFRLDDYTDSIKDVMAKKRHRDFPILDKNEHYVGMVSRRNLLGIKRAPADPGGSQRKVTGCGQHRECRHSGDHRSSPPGLSGDHGSGLFPEPAGGLYCHDPLSDLSGTETGDPEKYRRSSLCGHYLRHADVPFPHLHGPGPGGSRTAGGDRRYPVRRVCNGNVCGRQ